MKKRLFTRFKALFAAARFTVYTKPAASAKPKFNLEPRQPLEDPATNVDNWLFASDEEIKRHAGFLSSEMDSLADSMTGLRETLALIAGEAPFPIEATTLTPNAIIHADGDLFDGECSHVPSEQDTTIGGHDAILFDEERRPAQVAPDEARHAA